jgi:glyoxalase family protein
MSGTADTSGASVLQPLEGFHHLTMVTRHAPTNARFYRDTLRLRLVKKTVNFDMPSTYHLYYGDHLGAPGTLLTFFEWPNAAPGSRGWGGTHHIALAVPSGAALAYWRGQLEREGLDVAGPFADHGAMAIRFPDPDGLLVELVAPAGEDVPDGAPAIFVPAMAIGALHHVNLYVTDRAMAAVYYRDLLGFAVDDEGPNYDDSALVDMLFRLDRDGVHQLEAMRLVVTAVERDAMPHAQDGPGQTHHIAFNAPHDAVELAWQARIGAAGVPVSEVRDRSYFRSIYFNDPDGHLLEIATAHPGFAIDEPPASLGERLCLPAWLEERRAQLEASLVPVTSDE